MATVSGPLTLRKPYDDHHEIDDRDACWEQELAESRMRERIGYDRILEEVQTLSPTPIGPDTPCFEGLPLDEWMLAKASWHRQLEESETGELVGDALEQLARDARFHQARTPADVLLHSCRYVRWRDRLDLVTIPEERRSRLAELLEVDARDYLLDGTDCSRLAAAAILLVAEEAHVLGARYAHEFAGLKAKAIEDVLAARPN